MLLDVVNTRNRKKEFCELYLDINNAIFCTCAFVRRLSLVDVCVYWCWTEAVKSLWSWMATKSCRSSRLLALRCDMHLGAGTSPLYRDGMESFVPPRRPPVSSALISAAGKVRREGAFACERRDKNCGSERKIEGRKQGGRWIGLFLCWQKERGFLLLIRAQIFHKFLETLSYK